MSLICYNPIKGCDDVISQQIPNTNPYMIANIRALMDEENPIQLVPEVGFTPLKDEFKGGKIIFAAGGTGKTSIADNINLIDSDIIWGDLLGVLPANAGAAYELLSSDQKGIMAEKYRQKMLDMAKEGKTIITANKKMIPYADVIIYHKTAEQKKRRTIDDTRTNQYDSSKFADIEQQEIEEAVKAHPEKKAFALGENQFAGNVLLEDPEFNTTVYNVKNNSLNQMLIDFMSNFGINFKFDESNVDGSFFNALDRIVELQNTDKIPEGVGKAIAFMMQRNGKVTRIISNWIAEEGTYTVDQLVDKDNNGTKLYGKLNKSEYFEKLGKVIEEQLRNSYESKKKGKVTQFIQDVLDIIKDFFDIMTPQQKETASLLKSFAINVSENVLANNPALITKSIKKPGSNTLAVRLYFENEIDKPEYYYEKSIIQKLNKLGITLTGSAAIATQGKVMRPIENPFHDLDFKTEALNRKELEETLSDTFENLEHFRHIDNAKKPEDIGLDVTESYVTLSKPFYVKQPNPKVNYFELYSKEDDSLIGKITEKSDLILENGITGKVLDFFVGREKDKYPTINIEAGGFTYKMANYKNAMEKKLNYGRVKDLFDYNRMVENDFIPSVLPGEKPIKRVSVEELKQEIIKFRQKMNSRQKVKLANMITSPTASYKQLRENFKFDERRKRVKMIAVNFSLIVDDFLADYSELSRSQVIKGTVIDGQTVGGVANIFNEVYSRIEEQYNEAKLNGNQVKMDKIQKVFDNWGALMVFAQAEVSMVEDIKIGLDMSFVKQGNENSGEFNDAFKFVMEEAKREAWQDAHDTKSAYGSIPKEIRKVLSRIPQYDKNGEQVFDDLDFPVMIDRLEAHQMLLRTIGKRRNEAHMMKMLRDNIENLPWIEDVLYELEDPVIRTQFYTGLKRAFQFYSMITQKLKNGVYNTFAPILNKPKGQVSYSTYFANLKLGGPKSDKTIFKRQGNFNIVIPRAIQQLKAFIGTQIDLESESVFKVHKFDNLKKNDKKAFIQHVFDSLNISYTDAMLNKLTSKKADTNKVKNLIADIAEFGLRLDSDEIKGNSILSYEMLLKRVDKSADNIDERGILESKISAILDILANYQDKIQFESRIRYDENSYSSDVLPSFMTDLIEDLKSFVDDNDIDGLRKYIADNYFTNSQFYSFQRKEILNQWLKELYYGDIESAATFINNISFDRNLGNERTKFSKFTRHDLLLQMFTKFHAPSMAASRKNVQYINKDDFQKMLDHDIANEFQDKENDSLQLDKAVTYMINGEDQKYKYTIRTRWKESERNDYAFYNMFVLGDSGISKFIKAKRYGIDEIVEMMYTVYLQEGQRKGLAKIFNDDLIKAGYKPNNEQLKNASRFTFLPFLNEDYADGKYAQMVDRTVDQKGTVKAAIKAYLDDRAENLKTNFDKNKLLTLSKNKKSYSYLNQTVTINDDGTSNLNDVLKDYVYNSYFANIQQSQIFNIDPGFVKNSKAYQKRNKQVSASGDPLNIDAINPYTGEKYSETGIENTVYFQDINLDVENFDKNFAQTIAYQFGKEFLGKNAEGKTYEELVKVGRGTDKYQNYRSITLTDGQGYRTLDSYVSVMGMAAKWTKEMQNAYTTIKEITKNVKPNENLTPEQITKVTDQMLVLQPLKPFFYGFEKFKLSNGQIINIPVQNKYAEIILIPELLPAGSKLRDMAYWMQNHVGADGNPQPIDVVGSTEIAKVGNFGATDIDYKTNDKHEFVDVNGNVIKDGKKNPKFHELAVKLNDDSFSEQLGKAYVHQLPYKNYRIQTNVPEHINSSNLFGTQIRKLILKNTNFKKLYDSYVSGNKINLGDGKMVDLNGKNLVKFYNSLIVANIVDSYEDFLEKAKDPETVKKVLSQMTVNSEMESNDHIIAFAEGLALFEPSLEHSASSLFLSWFKKTVNKQSIKGGSAVQASAMGLSGYEEDGGLKYITNKNNTNILEVECEIPWDLNYTDVNGNNVVLDYNTYCKPDGNLILSDVVDTEGKFSTFLGEDGKTSYIPLIELDYPNITSLLAYRIPTENHYSMINLRVKRFSNKTTGGVIKVPPQGTVIAGFDFDIDKLFLMRYEFKDKKLTQKQIAQIWRDIYTQHPQIMKTLEITREKSGKRKEKLYTFWEEAGLKGTSEEFFRDHLEQNKGKYTTFIQYDYTKTPAANDRMARNNMLIQLIQERLKDEDTFSERYTPGGFANPSIAAKKMRLLIFGNEELDNKNLKGDTYNFADIEDNSKSYEDPEPNYDIFDPMTMVEYTMQNNIAGDLIGIFANHNANHAISTLLDTFHLKEPIIFGSFINAKSDYELGADLLTKEVTLANGRVINSALSLAEFLSASVDAVKDPVLNFLNLNTVTADSAAMLARLGYSIEDIGLLLNQPVIKALCDIHLMSGRFDIQASIDELLDIYAKSKIYPPESVDSKKFTQDKLAANIVNSRLGNIDEKFRIEQLEILKMFANIQDKAQVVSEFVRNTKFTAANAVGGSFGGMYQQMDNINNFLINYQDTKNLPVVFKMGEANIPYKKYDITGNKNEYIMQVINNPFGYEQAMYDATRSMIDYVCSNYLPYNNYYYDSARAILTDLSSSVALSEDVINTIHRDVLVHYLNNLENSQFDPYSPMTFMDGNKEVTKTKREYYEQDFPETLYNFLKSHPEVAEKELFRFLQFDATEKEDGKLDIKLSFRTVNIDENTEMIKESWGDLINDENPQLKELGEMLYFYGFFTKGFDFGHNSIIHLVPSEFLLNMEVYKDVKYTDVLKDISEKNGMVSDEFIRQFIANHTDTRTFITEPKGRYLSDWKTEMYKDGKLQNKVLIDLNSPKNGPKNPFGKYNGVLKEFEIKPVVMVDGEYYMCMDKGFRTEEQLALYQRFTPSNLKNTGVRYGTVNYTIDNEVTPESSVDDTQSIFGKQGTIEQQETPKIDYSKLTEKELIDLAYEYIDLNPDMDNILGREMFKDISREDLIDTIQDMRQELVNKKIIDPESGNPLC